MFYKNQIKPRDVKTITLSFDNFESNPEPSEEPKEKKPNVTSMCYNFKVKNGVLEDGYGFQDLMLPYSNSDQTLSAVQLPSSEVIKLWCFRWFDTTENVTDTFIFYLNETKTLHMFYEYKYFMPVLDCEVSFLEEPNAFSYRYQDTNMFILSSAKDEMVVYNGDTFVFEGMPKISSSCIHENAFYGILATDDSSLVYTKEIVFPNPEETEFETLTFMGGEGERLRKLFSLNDYVYLFRDNGIVKLYPYGTSSTLSISHVYYSNAFIIPESIQRCGDEIIYLARDGFYSFNGSTANKLDLEIFDKIEIDRYETFTSASQKGKYFLACRINFDDEQKIMCEARELGYKNNALLIYDTDAKTLEIVRGVDIRDLEAVESHTKSKMICCFYNDYKGKIAEFTTDGKFYGEVMQKVWTSVKTDCGYKGKTKVIKKVKLNALKDCQIKIETDLETKIFNITGKEKNQTIKLGVRGETFSVSFISTSAGQRISDPEFEIDVLL